MNTGGIPERRLRVALLHYAAPPVVGGVERTIGRHAGLMAAAGHRVRILAGRGASPGAGVEFQSIALADTLHPEVASVGESLAAGTEPPEFGRLVQRLERQLSESLADFDVVIAHNVASMDRNLVLTAALHDVWRAGPSWQLVLWHHDLAWAMPGSASRLYDGRPWSLLKEPWPGAMDVTISEARRRELAHLRGCDPADIDVIPGGVDVPRLPGLGALLESDPLLLAPVRVTARKNLDLAIRVVAELHSRGLSAGLAITGPVDPHNPAEQAYRARLDELIDELGIRRHVVFLSDASGGAPSDETVIALYRVADALLLPSFDEGFGLPILEAAVARLPIVCSDLPSIRALAGDDATYFDPRAGAGAVAAVIVARLHREPSVRLARHARRQYAWPEVYGTRIAPLLERAAARARGPSPLLPGAFTSPS